MTEAPGGAVASDGGARRPSDLGRGALGGVLMGLANLVPGVSGGTMLLAVGVFPHFIEAVSDVTRFRLRWDSLRLLAVVVGASMTSILLLAGALKGLVVDHRWVMYSLFIGFTLGGVPVVWRLIRRLDATVVLSAGAGIALMAVIAVVQPGAGEDGSAPWWAYLFGGLVGAAAMILPGISGGYLLLLLGLYVPILGAVDDLKRALFERGFDLAALFAPLGVLLPVGMGVALGVLGMSNLIRWLLRRAERATLGALLGLLIGAVIGLWPFHRPSPPQVGDLVRGRLVTADRLADIAPEDWPSRHVAPSAAQAVASLALIAAGFWTTRAIGAFGREERG